jgi:prepilin-type N-terminal cleavage/methylation domain-containing protein/prepilin-type processing-associated H-X9-DG protein
MRHSFKRGFTLVELLVVIAIIGTLVALLLPAVQAARGTAQNNTCKNNIRQLAMAAINMDSQQKLPGYVNAVEDLTSQKAGQPPQFTRGRRASWIVMLFPYMENGALWDAWSKEFDPPPSQDRLTAYIENLTCASDAPETPGLAWTNYVCNAGQAFGDPTRGSNGPGGLSEANTEYAGNGIFFDSNKNKNITASALDGREDHPPIQTRLANIPDGTSKTMMLSENAQAWFWTYDEPSIKDTKHVFGFVWSNQPRAMERINGSQATSVVPLSSMSEYAQFNASTGLNESYGWPSSLHPGGVNVAFCDGHVVFVPETVEPLVYGQLMTSNAKRSKLFDQNRPAQQAADRLLPQPEPTF